MLVDPLAALFRPELEGQPPLRLEVTRVEVELLPPLARIAITRMFINYGDEAVEALLTLPPAGPGEIVHGLVVTINGIAYRATAQARGRAARAHDAAVILGGLAIVQERLTGDVRLISISGIAPKATVEVCIESLLPLERAADDQATLAVALSASPQQINHRLPDSDHLIVTPLAHPATLTVTTGGLPVTLGGGAGLVPDRSTPVDCAGPVILSIAASDSGRLDRSAYRPGEPDGWEATVEAPLESMAGGLEPVGVSGERAAGTGDWIAGRAILGGRAIRVTAPSPMAQDTEAPANTRAMSAFAAAHLIDAANPVVPAALRRAANILDADTSLAFVGPDGEATGEMPTMRKVALPGVATAVACPSYAVPPDVEVQADETSRPNLTEKIDQTTPGSAAPTRYDGQKLGAELLGWTPAGLLVLWLLGATVWVPFPMRAVTVGLLASLALNAYLHRPRAEGPDQIVARRRSPLLLTLAVPLIASWAGGPLGLLPDDIGATATRWAILFQGACFAASALAPLVLLVFMRGARRFTLEVGAIAFVLTFLAVSTGYITLSPGD